MATKTYKDDILDTSANMRRKYNLIQNDDGTVSFEDVTVYLQVGDSFGAADINAIMNGQNIRYVQETDKVQIMDAEGVWHDWKQGGLISLSILAELGANGFDVTTSSQHKGTVALSGNELVVTGGGADGYQTVTFTSKEPVYFNDYNKLVVNCSVKNVPNDITLSVVSASGESTAQTTIAGTGTYELNISDVSFGYIKFSSYLGNSYGYTFDEIKLSN